MKRFIFTTFLSASALVLGNNISYGQDRFDHAQQSIEKILDCETVSQASVGICAITGGGRKIVDINSQNMLIPASNMKLISSGAAIHHFGPDHRFETAIGYDGKIIDGILEGNLYIIGGADPTIASIDSIAPPIDTTFAQWASLIMKAGISQIKGRIIGDGRYFDPMIEEPTWLIEDAGTYYGAGATGLMFYENMQSFNVSAGAAIGDSVNISVSYPEVPWMTFRYNCSTGSEGTGDQLFMFTSELAPVAEIRGTFGVDRKAKRLDCSNKFPEYTCAHYFKEYLEDMGIYCAGAGDFRLDTSWEPAGEIVLLGKTFSPELDRIIFQTNHASNNLYAETLLRTLGRETTGSACYDSSYVAVRRVFDKLGIDASRGCRIKDGSGLSRQNYISSDFLCRFLLGMMSSPHFESFVESLPSPGSNGTLAYNMKKQPEDLRSRIKVKSGSMNGVRCYSGYIIPTDGGKEDVIIFSLMVNNCTSPTWEVRNLLDSVMATLAGMN
jgi:D-alanyl-D-alanine carboxypeptidase/D-alanyl-D-alanine-endopeptidase (penicillin-binding protein 4)